MIISQTERLVIRELTLADAPFVLELLNEPAFHEYIGDRGVRDIPGAEKYLQNGPLASYAKHGFGLWGVTRHDGTPLGICGLLQRDYLENPDLGYAFFARHHGQGYAHEAAAAVVRHADGPLGRDTLHALTAFRNPASVRLLGKLGFDFVKFFDQPGHPEPSRLFTRNRADPSPAKGGSG